MPCKQLHSYDYGGPYAGFQGAVNFYREIDRMVNTPDLEASIEAALARTQRLPERWVMPHVWLD